MANGTLQPIVSGTDQSGKAATKILSELQGLKVVAVAGAAADTDIAVTGLKLTAAQITAGTADTVVAILRLDRDATAANINITSIDLTELKAGSTAGNLQLDNTVTTGDTLIVIYFSKPS